MRTWQKPIGVFLAVVICGLILGAAHWLGMLSWWTGAAVVVPMLGGIGGILFESDSDSAPASTDSQQA